MWLISSGLVTYVYFCNLLPAYLLVMENLSSMFYQCHNSCMLCFITKDTFWLCRIHTDVNYTYSVNCVNVNLTLDTLYLAYDILITDVLSMSCWHDVELSIQWRVFQDSVSHQRLVEWKRHQKQSDTFTWLQVTHKSWHGMVKYGSFGWHIYTVLLLSTPTVTQMFLRLSQPRGRHCPVYVAALLWPTMRCSGTRR